MNARSEAQESKQRALNLFKSVIFRFLFWGPDITWVILKKSRRRTFFFFAAYKVESTYSVAMFPMIIYGYVKVSWNEGCVTKKGDFHKKEVTEFLWVDGVWEGL